MNQEFSNRCDCSSLFSRNWKLLDIVDEGPEWPPLRQRVLSWLGGGGSIFQVETCLLEYSYSHIPLGDGTNYDISRVIFDFLFLETGSSGW